MPLFGVGLQLAFILTRSRWTRRQYAKWCGFCNERRNQ